MLYLAIKHEISTCHKLQSLLLHIEMQVKKVVPMNSQVDLSLQLLYEELIQP